VIEIDALRQRATLQAIAAASPNTRHVAGAAVGIVIVMDGGMPQIETFDEARAWAGLRDRLGRSRGGRAGEGAARRPGGSDGPHARVARVPDCSRR
jgi:hypothetical protein